MSTKYYFNWNSLKRDSNGDFSGILCLTYALTVGYNKKLAANSSYLSKKLYLDRIPAYIFRKKFLKTNREGEIYSYYICENPLTYFKNKDFLSYRLLPKRKVEYLFLLSHRRMSENISYIPKNYIDEKYWDNPLVTVKNDKLYFILEKELRS